MDWQGAVLLQVLLLSHLWEGHPPATTNPQTMTGYPLILPSQIGPSTGGVGAEGVEVARVEVTPMELTCEVFFLFLQLCIIRCTVLGNIVRWYASSLLGSYVHQELFSCSIGTVLNNVNNTNVFSCVGSGSPFYFSYRCSFSSMLQMQSMLQSAVS